MDVTTFDFGDVCLGTIEDDENEFDAQGVVTFGRGSMLQLSEEASGRLGRLREVEDGFITFVGADGNELTDDDYQAIAAIHGLRSVDFDDTSINETQVSYFCRDGMIGLNLATPSFSDQSMEAIASIKTLEHLFISRSSVTDEGIAALRDHPTLETLHASGTAVTAASADVIASLPALSRLEIPAADDSVLIAAARPHTAFVHLRGGAVTERGLAALATCESLTWLGLMAANISGCHAFAYLRRLATLFLNDSTFDDVELAQALASLPQLSSLRARNTPMTDDAVAHLAAAPSLENVDFEGTAVTRNGLALLTQLPKPFDLG